MRYQTAVIFALLALACERSETPAEFHQWPAWRLPDGSCACVANDEVSHGREKCGECVEAGHGPYLIEPVQLGVYLGKDGERVEYPQWKMQPALFYNVEGGASSTAQMAVAVRIMPGAEVTLRGSMETNGDVVVEDGATLKMESD